MTTLDSMTTVSEHLTKDCSSTMDSLVISGVNTYRQIIFTVFQDAHLVLMTKIL